MTGQGEENRGFEEGGGEGVEDCTIGKIKARGGGGEDPVSGEEDVPLPPSLARHAWQAALSCAESDGCRMRATKFAPSWPLP